MGMGRTGRGRSHSGLVISTAGPDKRNIFHYREPHALPFKRCLKLVYFPPLPSHFTVKELVTAQCTDLVSEGGPEHLSLLTDLCNFSGAWEMSATQCTRGTNGSSWQPHSTTWCPAYAAIPDKATKAVSLDTLTLPCARHTAVNPSTPQVDLDSAGMREQRETLKVL